MNLELRENMYVRTKDGIIAKVDYIEDNTIIFDKDLYRTYGDSINFLEKDNLERIVKASYNIIDILEVGDYVNGYKVSAIYNPNGDKIVNITLIMEYGYETINTYIDDYSINSIVTKEQFEQMAYKVGE